MYPMMGNGLGTWLVLLLLLMLLVAAGVAAVALVARQYPSQPPLLPQSGPNPAEEALRLRYATGEIDTEEYEKRLAALRAGR
jgi:putative membrane protein